jgi:hypothetical protein
MLIGNLTSVWSRIHGPIRECHVALSDWPSWSESYQKFVGSNGNQTRDLRFKKQTTN